MGNGTKRIRCGYFQISDSDQMKYFLCYLEQYNEKGGVDFYVVMEVLSAFKTLDNLFSEKLSILEFLQLLYELFAAVAELKYLEVAHNDLKPQNIAYSITSHKKVAVVISQFTL